MPRIKLLESRAGANFAHDVGDVLEISTDIPANEAQRLLERGSAELVIEMEESATLKQPERAARTRRGTARVQRS